MNNTKYPSQIKKYTDLASGSITNYQGTQQAIGAGVNTTITMPFKSSASTVLYDYGTANSIKVKRTGRYNISFAFWCNATTGSPVTRGISIVKNAGATSICEVSGHQTSAVNTQWSGVINAVATLTVNDYVYARFYSAGTTHQMGATGLDIGYMPTLTLEFIEE